MCALRAIGDDAEPERCRGRHRSVWVHRMRPRCSRCERWWVLLLPLLTSVALGATTVALSDRHDLGSRPSPRTPRRHALSGPAARPTDLSVEAPTGTDRRWSIGVFVLGATTGRSRATSPRSWPNRVGRFIALRSASPLDSYLAYARPRGAAGRGRRSPRCARLRRPGRAASRSRSPVPSLMALAPAAQIWVATALSR